MEIYPQIPVKRLFSTKRGEDETYSEEFYDLPAGLELNEWLVGDPATNIAKDMIYIIQGGHIRLESKEYMKK